MRLRRKYDHGAVLSALSHQPAQIAQGWGRNSSIKKPRDGLDECRARGSILRRTRQVHQGSEELLQGAPADIQDRFGSQATIPLALIFPRARPALGPHGRSHVLIERIGDHDARAYIRNCIRQHPGQHYPAILPRICCRIISARTLTWFPPFGISAAIRHCGKR